MGHRFIDHTADVAADLDGATLGELFASAARALTDTMTPLDGVAASLSEPVALEAGTLEDLLVDWLNELLYRFEVRNMLFASADLAIDERSGRWVLSGTVTGELFDAPRHPMRVLVKSATYHGLHVSHAADGWHARVVFDI
jgi:SHS2 domain-containing protein